MFELHAAKMLVYLQHMVICALSSICLAKNIKNNRLCEKSQLIVSFNGLLAWQDILKLVSVITSYGKQRIHRVQPYTNLRAENWFL